MRAAIEQGPRLGTGSPTGITISRRQPVTPPKGTVIHIQSDSNARWRDAKGSVQLPNWAAYYHGFKLTDEANSHVVQTIHVWTDIGGPTYKPFTEVYPPDTDTSGDGTNDGLRIDENNMDLMTHFARHPDDNRDGDDSPGARDRGVVGQDREFSTGHEISSRFDDAYGVLTCVSPICTINMDNHILTEMTGWAFVPKVMTDGRGGSRSPQILVEDTDYRYFGYWRRGPDHDNGGGYDIWTFADGSEPYTGDTQSLTGRATYVGPASGLYVKDADGGSSSTGQFTATVTLHADFGSKQTISGSMGDFRDGSKNLGWSLGMGSTGIDASKFSGTTSGLTYAGQDQWGQAVYNGSADNVGGYEGAFYGGADDNNYPYGVAGTFTGKFDDGAVIGGFGASQTAIHPDHP